jgi:hypothetical protein
MLRWVCGDSAFYTGVRNYLNDPAVEYGYAHTPDLQYHLEAASGKNLTEFFHDWFFGQGYPSYTTHVIWLTDNDYHVFIDQYPSHSSVQFFEMPVPLRFYGPNLDTTIVFDHTFSGEMFDITLPVKPDSVQFDPDMWLCATHNAITIGNGEEIEDAEIRVWPNPASEVMYIQIPEDASALRIYDAMGRMVSAEVTDMNAVKAIDLHSFSPGTYRLTFEHSGRLVTKSFVVQ